MNDARASLRLLFDHGVPSPLRRLLADHAITFARERGWQEYANGRLIAAAEEAGFALFVTCDKNLVYQQNLVGRVIAVLVLPTNIWPHLEPYGAQIMAAIERAVPGAYEELELPRPALVRRRPPSRD
jgi:hypothetical protein